MALSVGLVSSRDRGQVLDRGHLALCSGKISRAGVGIVGFLGRVKLPQVYPQCGRELTVRGA